MIFKRFNHCNGTRCYHKRFLDAQERTWVAVSVIITIGFLLLTILLIVRHYYQEDQSFRHFKLPLSPAAMNAYAYTEQVVGHSADLKPSTVKDKVMVASIEMFTTDEALDIEHLVNGESGFNPTAINKSSGACGLFQSLPCSKMPCGISRSSEDVDCQINWGLHYIKNRYGNPNNAWAFWMSNSPHWY